MTATLTKATHRDRRTGALVAVIDRTPAHVYYDDLSARFTARGAMAADLFDERFEQLGAQR